MVHGTRKHCSRWESLTARRSTSIRHSDVYDASPQAKHRKAHFNSGQGPMLCCTNPSTGCMEDRVETASMHQLTMDEMFNHLALLVPASYSGHRGHGQEYSCSAGQCHQGIYSEASSCLLVVVDEKS